MITHHAYYIEGSLSEFEAYKAQLKPLYARAYERFGIDEARELIEKSALKNFQQTVFLIAVSSITSEAQQALLKLFEEPQQGTVFVLLVPHGILLPTLRSRMLAYPLPISEKSPYSHSAQSGGMARPHLDFFQKQAALFLKADGKTRSEEIAKLLKDEDNQKERVRDFLQALEIELSNNISNAQARAGLADIAKVRSYVSDRSPSLKMLLEHLALSLPKL